MTLTTDVKEIKELFSQSGMIVRDIDIQDNVANVYIEVNPTGIYTIYGIENIIKKIKDLRTVLVDENLIEDITLGDLYQGTWRILTHFKPEE